MQHSVDRLHLEVRSPPGREVAAARLAEQFAREVLEQFGDIVEARWPGRVVLIRRMAMRWSLSEAEMADPANVANRAAELADTVMVRGGGSPHATDTVAAFDDAAGWLAAYLRQRAAGSAGKWFHATWRDAERHGTASVSPLRRETVVAALSRLRATGELAGLLAGLPPATIAALEAALVGDGAGAQRLEATDAAPADTTPVGSELAGAPPPLASPADDALTGVEAALRAAAVAAVQRADEEPRQPVAPASLTLAEPDGQAGLPTRFGGLFYLLSLALELGIGEALWETCLPEGLILAHAAAALLGPDAAGDPAPSVFGGVAIHELLTWPAVSPEQQTEVYTELLAATAAALPRYGVAPNPEVLLDLVQSPVGRMLVAFGHGPFALFATPAPDARATAVGLAAFLSAWPGSFPPPRATKVLLGLDASGRLQSSSGPRMHENLFLPSAPTASAAALLTQVCGTMAELFTLRVGVDLADAAEVVSRYLAIPGHVALQPEAMTVVLPMAGIDLAVRRAALDRDAGWVPWLNRTVRIEFAIESGGESGPDSD